MNIVGCKVSKQLNGTNLFIVFEGTDKQVCDAYNTLWNCNAINGELEWLNDGCAVVIGTEAQFRKGLVNREIFHLMDDESTSKSYKGHRGGFAAIAKQQADTLWATMDSVRVITPQAPVAPYFYKMGGVIKTSEWACERPDENVN